MSWDDSYLDLLTICAYAGDGAPWTERHDWASQAAKLLATELVARLSLSRKNHNPTLQSVPFGSGEAVEFPPVPWHFAYRDLQSTQPPGGLRRAQMYLYWGSGPLHFFPGAGTVPQAGATQGEYDLTLVSVLQQGAVLLLAVVAAVGAETFADYRQTFFEYMSTTYPDRYPPGDS